ncbi:unnamed protein product, partial [marine sediment metagenome]
GIVFLLSILKKTNKIICFKNVKKSFLISF